MTTSRTDGGRRRGRGVAVALVAGIGSVVALAAVTVSLVVIGTPVGGGDPGTAPAAPPATSAAPPTIAPETDPPSPTAVPPSPSSPPDATADPSPTLTGSDGGALQLSDGWTVETLVAACRAEYDRAYPTDWSGYLTVDEYVALRGHQPVRAAEGAPGWAVVIESRDGNRIAGCEVSGSPQEPVVGNLGLSGYE